MKKEDIIEKLEKIFYNKKYDYSHKLTHIDACKSARFSGAVIRTSPTLSNFSDFAPQVRRHRTMRKSAR